MKNKVFEVTEKMIEETWQNSVLEVHEYDLELPKSIMDHMQLKADDQVYFILKNDSTVEIRRNNEDQ
jgi:hypothetical protein